MARAMRGTMEERAASQGHERRRQAYRILAAAATEELEEEDPVGVLLLLALPLLLHRFTHVVANPDHQRHFSSHISEKSCSLIC